MPEEFHLCDKCRKAVLQKGWPDEFNTEPAGPSKGSEITVRLENSSQSDSDCPADEDFVPYTKKRENVEKNAISDFNQIAQNLKNTFQESPTCNAQTYEILSFLSNLRNE